MDKGESVNCSWYLQQLDYPLNCCECPHLLCPGKNDIFLQQVSVVQVFKDDRNTRQQLNLVQLHNTLKTSQQILLSLLVVVAELKTNDTPASSSFYWGPRNWRTDQSSQLASRPQPAIKDTLPRTYTQKVAFILLDLVSDVLVKEQLTQDEGAHGLNIKTLRLCQDFLVGTVDGFVLLPLLQVTTWHRIKWARPHFKHSTFSFSSFYCPKTKHTTFGQLV